MLKIIKIYPFQGKQFTIRGNIQYRTSTSKQFNLARPQTKQLPKKITLRVKFLDDIIISSYPELTFMKNNDIKIFLYKNFTHP